MRKYLQKKDPLRKVLLLITACCLCQAAFSQQSVTGRVTDQKGDALLGVSVKIKGTPTGTVTDINGKYTIVVPQGSRVLVFSSIGFIAQEKTVADGVSSVNIRLLPDMVSLAETVIVGYGTQNKRDITGAISKISGEEVDNQPHANLASMMNGHVAGVQITTNTGTPGGDVTVSIRGNTSLNSGNDPLYVIDGVPASGLVDINPDDVESIEVLKDASATAIYGARASNGVVLINTKRGTVGKPVFSFNTYYGYQEVTHELSMMNAEQQYAYILKGVENRRREGANVPVQKQYDADYKAGYNVDWQDEIFQQAPVQNYYLGLRGGTQAVKYALGLGYFDQKGVVISSGFKRYHGNFNIDVKASDRIRLSTTLSFSRTIADRVPENGDPYSVIANAKRTPAFTPVYDTTGAYSVREWPNAVAYARETHYFSYNARFLGNAWAEIDLVKNLTLKILGGADFGTPMTEYFIPSTLPGGVTRPAKTNGAQNGSWLNENTLTYTNTFNNIHKLTVLVGQSTQEYKGYSYSEAGSLGATDLIFTLNASAQRDQAYSTRTSWGVSSLFGRINYALKDKYLMTFNIRRDGSSRFGKDNKYAVFPAASIGWRVSGEPFFQNVHFINDLKLRASLGTTGNQSIGDFSAQGAYLTGADYNGYAGVKAGDIPVDNLTWESTKQYNVGLDIAALKNRLTFTADAYIKRTTGLLFSVPLPSTTGFATSLQNLGKIGNKGIEFAVHADIIKPAKKAGFSWSSDFNISFNENKVLELPGHTPIINTYSPPAFYSANASYITEEGKPIGMFYGYKWTGEIYPTDQDAQADVDLIVGQKPLGGTFRYENISGPDGKPDKVIDPNDRQIIGSPFPKFTGGFGNSVQFKNFDLKIFLQFVYGNTIFNQSRMTSDRGYVYDAATTDMINAWGEPGQITKVHKAWGATDNMDNQFSSAWLEDGSYLRVKDLTLGYTFPKSLYGKLRLSNARIYLSATNMLTFTRYKGYDPEVNTAYDNVRTFGVDMGAYPQVRSFLIGINVNF